MSAQEAATTQAETLVQRLRGRRCPGGDPAGRLDLHGDLQGLPGDRSALTQPRVMASGPRNPDEARAYRAGVWARRDGQQLGGSGGGSTGGKSGCALVLLGWAGAVVTIAARVKGWSA